jgi:hypothetical protein
MGIHAATAFLISWMGLCNWAWAGPDWGAVAGDPEASWAYAEQEVLPALSNRSTQATLRIEARGGYFKGEREIVSSFPELVGLDLSDGDVVRGRLLRLDQRAENRARERLSPVPPLASQEQYQTVRDALEEALHLEAEMDSLERRYLVALRVLYETFPSTERRQLDELIAGWRPAPLGANPATPERDRYAKEMLRFAEAEQGLERLLASIRRYATVPTSGPPDLSSDFEMIGDPATADAAVQRLLLGRPFQVAEAGAIVDSVSLKWFRGPALEAAVERAKIAAREAEALLPDAGDEAALQEGLAAAKARRDALDARLDSLPAGLSEVVDARRAVALVERDGAKSGLDVWEQALAVARGEVAKKLDVTAEASRAQALAEEAKLQADQARQQGKDTRSQRILDGLADSQARRQATWSVVTDFRQQTAVSASARADALRDGEESLRQHQNRSLLLSDRSEVDAAYQTLRETTGTLHAHIRGVLGALIQANDNEEAVRRQVAEERKVIVLEQRAVSSLVDEVERKELEKVLNDWDLALANEVEAAVEWVSAVRVARDDAFAQLAHARDLRRALEPMLSSDAAIRDRRFLLRDIGNEVSLLAPQLVATQRSNLRALTALPGELLDLNVLTRTLYRGLSIVAMFLLWWFGRNACVRGVRAVLVQARKSGFDLRPVDIQALSEPGVRLGVAAVDLVAGFVLMRVLAADFPTMGLFILAYLQVALFRLIEATFDLVAVAHPQSRPALFVFLPEVYDLSRRSLRFVIMFLIGQRFVDYLLETVLHLDAISVVVGWALGLLGFGLAVWLLHHWEPMIRGRLGRLNGSNWVVVQLSKEVTNTAFRAPRSLVGLSLLTLATGWDLLHRLASESRELGRLMNVVSRYQLGSHDDEEVAPPALSQALVEKIRGPEGGDSLYVPRKQADHSLDGVLSAWRREGRRGLIALVGDRGDGKRTTLDRFSDRAAKEGLHVRDLHLTKRLLGREDALEWLSGALDLPDVGGDVEEMVRQIQEKVPPGVYILHKAHWSYLRTVGGFDALRTLLYVLNTCGDHCFWVLSIHRPAWAYLSRLGSLVNVEVLRKVIVLDSFGESEVRELAMSRLERSGLAADFGDIVRSSIFGGDPEVEIERATATFFRLLAEASEGNPSVALKMWTRCLSETSTAGTLKVRIDDCISSFVLEEVTDGDLFTLAAVRTQNVIGEQELVRVTNMSPAQIRSTVKHLQALGVVRAQDDQVRIHTLYMPVVARTLRRRRFIPWAE